MTSIIRNIRAIQTMSWDGMCYAIRAVGGSKNDIPAGSTFVVLSKMQTDGWIVMDPRGNVCVAYVNTFKDFV